MAGAGRTPFDRAAERRGTAADHLVVGLGNPGDRYVGTRHNVGFETIGLLAERHGANLSAAKREQALVAEVTIGGRRVVLAQPTTYMNLSGESVARLVPRYGITDPRDLTVVHDEMDLPVGRLKVKFGGGAAGNKGIQSIDRHLHTPDYVRVRIGVGKPPHPRAGADYVLKRPPAAERGELDVVVQEAADAVELIIGEGVAEAMSRFNRR